LIISSFFQHVCCLGSLDTLLKGDTFALLAVRKNSYKVAIVFLRRGIDLLATNINKEDLIDVLKEQYFLLSSRLKVVLSKQIVYYHQTKAKTEIDELRKEQSFLKSCFSKMFSFIQECNTFLTNKIQEIDSDIAYKIRCELLHQVC
jgi:hypothetical protein